MSRDQPLNVFVQVNTSGEESKSGCKPEACVDVVKHVLASCKHLRFVGLMTIGRYGDTTSECFEVLCKCRDDVLKHVDLPEETQKNFQMSMGMSGDFPLAINVAVRMCVWVLVPFSVLERERQSMHIYIN